MRAPASIGLVNALAGHRGEPYTPRVSDGGYMRPTFLARAVIAGASMAAAMLVASEPAGAGDCVFPLVIVGRIDKASAQCDKDECSVRVALERRMYLKGTSASTDGLEVRLSSHGEAIDRRGSGRWQSPRDALTHLADQDRVFVAGYEDYCIAGPKVVLAHPSLLVRLGPARPTTALRETRAVTITATVLGPPADTHRDYKIRAWLPIEIVSVRDGTELVPPSFEDMAVIMPTAKVIGATVERPSVTSLRAGDTVVLEGSYQGSSSGHSLVIDRSITLPAPARARAQ